MYKYNISHIKIFLVYGLKRSICLSRYLLFKSEKNFGGIAVNHRSGKISSYKEFERSYLREVPKIQGRFDFKRDTVNGGVLYMVICLQLLSSVQ